MKIAETVDLCEREKERKRETGGKETERKKKSAHTPTPHTHTHTIFDVVSLFPVMWVCEFYHCSGFPPLERKERRYGEKCMKNRETERQKK